MVAIEGGYLCFAAHLWMEVSDCGFLWEMFTEKRRGEMHVIKNLNINSKLFSREVKIQTASFPLETCWVSMWFPTCVTHCWCLCYSHLALKQFSTFSGEEIHPTALYGSILEWDESFLSVFTVDLKGTYATGLPWKSPCWRQVKLRGKSFTVVFAIILVRLELQFSVCWNNTRREGDGTWCTGPIAWYHLANHTS